MVFIKKDVLNITSFWSLPKLKAAAMVEALVTETMSLSWAIAPQN